jgi:uncharacterized NAD(P)/FAD-binding protein YdhS
MIVRPRRVLVVGGGAGGVATAVALLRRAADGSAPVDLTLVERAAEVGPGLAYGTRDPHHLLNNYAGRMSAIEDDPAHLVRWCLAQGLAATAETFVSRETYGRYLRDLVESAVVPPGSRFTVLRDEVVDVTDAGSDYLATTASGAVLAADSVVLALGNPPPRRPRGLRVDDARFAVDPWDPDLLDRVGPHDSVLLVGTGLTTVDVSAQLASARPGVTITATSRHGLLPLHHVVEAPCPAPAFDTDVVTLREVLHEVRRCLAAGADWRCLVESVKAVANDLWTGFSLEDKERFTRHVGRRWEIARHRMAPAMAEIVDDLLSTGRLTVVPTSQVDPATYDLVVNCTGPAPVSSTGWNPLVDSLAVKGMLWPGPLGLGVDVDADGALVDADGLGARGMYAVGAARRGVDWEVAAVPDIRRQAVRLAEHLATADLDPVTELVG